MNIDKPQILLGYNRYYSDNAIHICVDESQENSERLLKVENTVVAVEKWFPILSGIQITAGENTVSNVVRVVLQQLLSSAGEEPEYQNILSDEAGEHVVASFWSYGIAKGAADLARQIVMLVLGEEEPEKKVIERANRAVIEFFKASLYLRLDQTSLALVRQAKNNGIPWMRIDPESRYIQLGQGCFLQRSHESITDKTTAIGVRLGMDKAMTSKLLDTVGVPIPVGIVARTLKQAQLFASKADYPVAVKPAAGTGKSRDVHAKVANETELREVFSAIRKKHAWIKVEKHIPGNDYRLLVVNGTLIAANRRIAAHVVGDGQHSIRELIDKENQNPDRGAGFTKRLQHIAMNKLTVKELRRVGMSLESIPENGMAVRLRQTANISTGGTSEDVMHVIHPDNREIAERAAKAIKLDIAGVDLIIEDISRSWRDIGGAVLEVNPTPGLRPHASNDFQDKVCQPIIDYLYPDKRLSRIPVATITGTVGKTTVAHMLRTILMQTGKNIGLCSTSGVYCNRQQLKTGDFAGRNGARALLMNPQVEMAVMEMACGGLIKYGMGIDACDVGAILNIDDDHIGLDGVESREQMAGYKRMVVDCAKNGAVLNAEDSLCLDIYRSLKDKPVCLVSMDSQNLDFLAHLENGGKGVCWNSETEEIILIDADQSSVLMKSGDIPATMKNIAVQNIQNACFAVALAWMMGIDTKAIRQGLQWFDVDFDANPGRFNYIDILPFEVILDFGHNPPGVKAVCEAAFKLSCKGRRLIALRAAADRGPDFIARVAQAASTGFDHYVVHNAKDLKGHPVEYVPEILRDALIEMGVAQGSIDFIPEEDMAVTHILDLAEEGDQVVLMVQDVFAANRQIQYISKVKDGVQFKLSF